MEKREIIRKLQQNEIEDLVYLKTLDLSNTNIEELPESIGELTDLERLDLSNTNIEELPESIGELTNLERLYLGYTNIEELPKWMGELRNLESLDLRYTNIEELPESIGKLTNLKSLDLSGTNIEELPKWMGELRNLESLDLRDINMEKLPEWIGKLTNLKSLDLSDANIEELPESIGKLTNLKSLDLSDTKIEKLSESIGKLTNLERLYLSSTKIEELPESIGKLTNLERLDLGNTNIGELPESIGKLANLERLDLSGTKIEELPEWIGKLTNLKRLDLSRTKLKKLPYSLFQLDLEYKFEKYFFLLEDGINLYQTQLTQMPISLFMQDRSLIKAYYEEERKLINESKAYYEEERKLINESKVILLGDGGAGKTYLVDRIFNNGEKLPRTHEPDTTTGILIRDYPMEMENGSIMSVRFWDFGGQQIMHSMHRCFLTSRSLYVVLLDARNDTQDFQAYYWLNNIKSFAPDAPVILVINKMDQNPTASVNQRELTRKYPNLKEVIRISALKDEKAEFDHFLYKLKQQLTILDGYGMEFPISWFQIMKTLEEKHQEEISYIEQEDYEKICIKNGIKDPEIQRWLLEWFNDLGVCFSFHKGNDSLSLSPYKVLDPKWLLNAIYLIIYFGREKAEKGILSGSAIKNILKNQSGSVYKDKTYSYRSTTIPFILEIMRKFEISYPLDSGREFIPALCQKEEGNEECLEEKKPMLEYLFRYEYLPENVLHRLMIQMNQWLDFHCIWRSGMRIQEDSTGLSALIRAEQKQLHIFIRSSSSLHEPWEMLNRIRECLLKIHRELNLLAEDVILFRKEEFVEEISYDRITKYLKNHHKEYYIPDINEEIDLYELIGKVEGREAAKNMEQAVAEGKELHPTMHIEHLTVHGGNVVVGEHSKQVNSVADNQKLLKKIQAYQRKLSEDQMEQIIALIQKSQKEQTGILVAELLNQKENKQPDQFLEKLKSYLGNAANATTVASFILELSKLMG
ncbi:Internalin-A precursor [Clostridiales bacterium CHKCI001]|nr:Internalin-A precursor [Clostridiales bacterium CHKCI001]